MKTVKSSLQAFLMSCLVAGWGLVYVGRIRWGIWVAALMYLGIVLLGVCGLIASPAGMYVFVAFIIVVKLVSAVMATVLARRYNGPPGIPRVRFHVCYVVVLTLIALTVLGGLRNPLLGYQNYFVPSGSMVPTLSIGDYIVSDTHAGSPKVGDIVVYRYNETEATKRVAGVAGDTLAIVDGDLIRNGENLGLFHAPAQRVTKDYSRQLAPLTVEPGHVYLLGDNRDVSNDSRFMGQVELKDVVGKVTGIWFSNEWSRMGTTFP